MAVLPENFLFGAEQDEKSILLFQQLSGGDLSDGVTLYTVSVVTAARSDTRRCVYDGTSSERCSRRRSGNVEFIITTRRMILGKLL